MTPEQVREHWEALSNFRHKYTPIENESGLWIIKYSDSTFAEYFLWLDNGRYPQRSYTSFSRARQAMREEFLAI